MGAIRVNPRALRVAMDKVLATWRTPTSLAEFHEQDQGRLLEQGDLFLRAYDDAKDADLAERRSKRGA